MATGTITPVVPTDDGHYFTIAELKAFDSAASGYPDADIVKARDWAEQRFEKAAHCAWVERTFTATLVGDGSPLLELPHRDVRSVSAASIDGTAIDVAALKVFPYGVVKRSAYWPADGIVSIAYAYGKTAPDEMELVKVATMMLAGHRLVPSNMRSNATSESTDVGSFRIAHATPGGKTGLLEVDAIASDLGHTIARVG